MESAKKNLQLIKPFTEASEPQNTSATSQVDVTTQISEKEKIDIYEITRRIREDSGPEAGKPVHKNQLVNKINFINFQDETLLINLKHRSSSKTLTLLVNPQPCLGN